MAFDIDHLSDEQLLQVSIQVLSAIAATPSNFGVTAGFVTGMELAKDTYETDLTGHYGTKAAAKSQTLIKDASNAVLTDMLREVIAGTKAAKTNEAEVASLGIPTTSFAAPSSATVPLAQVNTSRRMEHTISFRDAANENNKRKPKGVVGAEIWVKIGGPEPGNEKDCVFLSLDTNSPYVAHYGPEDAGKMAFYMLRWQLRDGTTSAWGETVSATITG